MNNKKNIVLRYFFVIGVYAIALFVGSMVFFKCIPLTYHIKGYNDVLTSIISFSAIIIGFYTAMYGILLTLKNSDILQRFKFYKIEGIFKFQLYESLVFAFLILIASITMQVARNYATLFSEICFSLWVAFLIVFSISTFRSLSLLLRIMFNDSKVPKETKGSISEEEKDHKLKDFNSKR
ncbi:hypothetical protein HCA69_00775 [Listeria grandensis]|uniref:Uncharacterized protein n=1 Tax=Listeria grandensis TaxID=1494963 RepID=A0A7X0Y1U2_9LIST|nr:hypothetical protein [Listeria grandensis]MBC1934877.1 hypothetical protein [Listeria grandensis]